MVKAPHLLTHSGVSPFLSIVDSVSSIRRLSFCTRAQLFSARPLNFGRISSLNQIEYRCSTLVIRGFSALAGGPFIYSVKLLEPGTDPVAIRLKNSVNG